MMTHTRTEVSSSTAHPEASLKEDVPRNPVWLLTPAGFKPRSHVDLWWEYTSRKAEARRTGGCTPTQTRSGAHTCAPCFRFSLCIFHRKWMSSSAVISSAHFVFLLRVLGSYTGHVDALVRGLSRDVSESQSCCRGLVHCSGCTGFRDKYVSVEGAAWPLGLRVCEQRFGSYLLFLITHVHLLWISQYVWTGKSSWCMC